MHTKRFNTFFKRCVQFHLDAIPRLPCKMPLYSIVFYFDTRWLKETTHSKYYKNQFQQKIFY